MTARLVDGTASVSDRHGAPAYGRACLAGLDALDRVLAGADDPTRHLAPRRQHET